MPQPADVKADGGAATEGRRWPPPTSRTRRRPRRRPADGASRPPRTDAAGRRASRSSSRARAPSCCATRARSTRTARPSATASSPAAARSPGAPSTSGRRTASSRAARSAEGRRDDRPHDRDGRARGAPVVGFPHSGGARLQEGVDALGAYASIFRAHGALEARRRSRVIGGPCAGGAAYSPALGDLVMMAGPDAQMFLTGPKIIERVTREVVTARRARRAEGPREDRRLAPRRGRRRRRGRPRAQRPRPPARQGRRARCRWRRRASRRAGDPSRHVPTNQRKVYDVRDVIAPPRRRRRACSSSRPRWARNMVVGLARIDGRPIGVIANQPRYLGGTLDADAADKGAWFVDFAQPLRAPARRALRHARASGPACARSARRCCAAGPTCCARSRSPRCRA